MVLNHDFAEIVDKSMVEDVFNRKMFTKILYFF
jgi:hypothetical protein